MSTGNNFNIEAVIILSLPPGHIKKLNTTGDAQNLLITSFAETYR
jgi:hypothetical protein